MDSLSPLVNNRIEQARYRFITSNEEGSLPQSFIHILPIKPISQNGPQCGIVALTMALQYLTGEEITVESIFDKAVANGYTKQGEMFDAEDLSSLSSHLLIISTVIYPIPSPSILIDYLLTNQCILIPYDCDRNHEPSNRKGIAAHWAIIVGVIMIDKVDGDIVPLVKSTTVIDDIDRFYVLAYHGKSKHLGVWSYRELIESNGQLREVGDNRKEDFIVKDITLGGLRDKCVVLKRSIL